MSDPVLAGRNRPNKKWTDEEIERLLTGLMKFGLSSWTDIAHRWRFEDRTTVDLKDKWRNLVGSFLKSAMLDILLFCLHGIA